MTIQVNPEQERIIGQAIEAGLIDAADEAVEWGIEAIRQRLSEKIHAASPMARNMAELFAHSPFAGLSLNFERDVDSGRDISL